MSKLTISSPKLLESSDYEAFMDDFPDMVYAVSGDGEIVFVNKKAVEVLKFPKEKLLGMNARQIYVPDVCHEFEAILGELKQDGEEGVTESCVVDGKGGRIEVEVRSFAFYDDAGLFVRAFSVLRDVRERVSLERELVCSSRLSAIGELSGCVAHDVSNPLAVVKLYCEMMLGVVDTCEPAVLKEQIVATQEAANKIEGLVGRMRDFARAEELHYSQVDVAEVIGAALAVISAKMESVTIDNRIDFGYAIKGASHELEQVFINVFGNAVEAMNSRPIEQQELLIWLEEGDAEYEVYVRDSGLGIEDSVREQMFKAFFTTKDSGTGLGLSISKAIIHKHEGRIHVESVVGEGTVFVIYLPKLSESAKA